MEPVQPLAYYSAAHITVKASRRFDRSIHGDLNHAIYLVSYQMRIAQILRWNLLPMGAIMIFSGWESGKLFMVSAIIVVLYTGSFYASSKRDRANKTRRRALQVLKEKLENSSI
jgi:hypothetical protein